MKNMKTMEKIWQKKIRQIDRELSFKKPQNSLPEAFPEKPEICSQIPCIDFKCLLLLNIFICLKGFERL